MPRTPVQLQCHHTQPSTLRIDELNPRGNEIINSVFSRGALWATDLALRRQVVFPGAIAENLVNRL